MQSSIVVSMWGPSHSSRGRKWGQEQLGTWEIGEGLGGTNRVNGQHSLLRVPLLNSLGCCKEKEGRFFLQFQLEIKHIRSGFE